MPPLVSAIVTTHERPDLVRRAVASVRAESYVWLEIIVVEDGFGLDAEELAGEPPVRLLQVDARGCAAARNAGLDAARGRYVIFLDDDDRALPNRISDLLEAAESDGHAICYGRTIKRSIDRSTDVIPAFPRNDAVVGFGDLLVHMPHVNSVLLRADALRRVGGFDLNTPNFDELSAWLRISDRGGSVLFRDRVVAEWNSHDAGLSGSIARNGTMKRSIVRLLEEAIRFARPANRAIAEDVLQSVVDADIASFDDYVRVAARGFRRSFN